MAVGKLGFAAKFEDLVVFRRAYKISLAIHAAAKTFPKEEQFGGIADQMRGASKSICANLAEGFAKSSVSHAEFRRFVMIALGSSVEMRVWLRYAFDLGLIPEDAWTG